MALRRLLIEGVLIVGSILLAFSIDAWWDGRQQRRVERSLLAGLEAEFRASQAQLDSVIDLHARQASQMARLTIMGESDIRAMSQDSLRLYTTALAQGRTFDTFGGQLDAILSADRLYILRDQLLREMLVAWSARLEDSGEEAVSMGHATDQVILRMGILGGPYVGRIPTEALQPITAEALITFLGDDQLMALSRAKFFWAAAYGSELGGLAVQADTILERLEHLRD